MKRIFVSDLDGTLILKGGKILDESINSVRKINNSEHIFTFATARPLHMARKYIRDFEIKNPVILSDGAMIYDAINDKILFEKYLDHSIVESISDFITKNKVNCSFYTKDEIFLYCENEFTIKWKKLVQNEDDKQFNPNINIYNDLDLVKKKFKIILKIIFLVNEIDNEDKIIEFLTMNKIDFIKIDGRILNIEIRPNNVDKSFGIRNLSKILKVNADDVIVFGNDINDVEMFKQAKHSFAVSNSIDALKQCCTEVIGSFDKNGVGIKMEEYINEK